jgi:peptide/nickel transport system ATP-binding protein
MYLGRIVEQGRADEVLRQPRHPYTQTLLASVLTPDGRRDQPPGQPGRLGGDMPSPAKPPAGCHFHPRCPLADAVCRQTYPPAVQVSATHRVHCLKLADS